MYEPLSFLEQIGNYFVVSKDSSVNTEFNSLVRKKIEDFLCLKRSDFYHSYKLVRDFKKTQEQADALKLYDSMNEEFCSSLKIPKLEDTRDFMDLVLYKDLNRIWGRNKLAYLVDNRLFDMFCEMKMPDLAYVDCVTKLPSECLYVDWNGKGGRICEGLSGTFIITDEIGDELNIVLVHLITSSHTDRVLNVTTCLNLALDNDITQFKAKIPDGLVTTVYCEDGIARKVDETLMLKTVYNFLIYLHASNRDIIISERTRKNHKRTDKVIHNKFREVKEFEVGFSFGRAIGKDVERVRYVGKKESSGVVHKPKSSHYRSAHWHHYWTGSGKDKKLIIKWVAGVIVNGDKAPVDNVKMREVN